MIEIIPTILVKTEEEFRKRLRAVESLVSTMQIDVVDGKFAQNVTWGDPAVIAALDSSMAFEVDLMVEDNEAAVREWLSGGERVTRIYFHQESDGHAQEIIRHVKHTGKEVGMSLNPGTPVTKLFPWAEQLDAVLFLGVDPGFGGQSFQRYVIKKVADFHVKFPEVPVTVDGGVTAEVAGELVRAGASRLAAGSFVYNHPDGPETAIRELQKAASGSSKPKIKNPNTSF